MADFGSSLTCKPLTMILWILCSRTPSCQSQPGSRCYCVAGLGHAARVRFCSLIPSEQSELGKRSQPSAPPVPWPHLAAYCTSYKCPCHESIWGQERETCTHAPGALVSFSCSSKFKSIKHWKKKNQWIKVLKIRFITHLHQELYLACPHRSALILGSQFLNLDLNCQLR